jgi:acetolactate synthase-1/3 small subunit
MILRLMRKSSAARDLRRKIVTGFQVIRQTGAFHGSNRDGYLNCAWGHIMEKQFYVITMLVANKPGVTSRVTGLFSGRGYNMESICGAPTHDPEVSRITIKTKATADQFIEIQKQLNRLIDVIKLRDMTEEDKAIKREMALVSVEITPENRAELIQVVDIFNAQIVNAGTDSYIVEVTGTEDKVNALIKLLQPLGIKKLTRSGILALYRELDETHR